jgi:hypothetical protein
VGISRIRGQYDYQTFLFLTSEPSIFGLSPNLPADSSRRERSPQQFQIPQTKREVVFLSWPRELEIFRRLSVTKTAKIALSSVFTIAYRIHGSGSADGMAIAEFLVRQLP